jgi:hypothetical protein
MAKVQALLIANSVATGDEFMKAQKEMNKPMVIFCAEEFSKPLEHFYIVAKDINELKIMYENKIFYTSSIPVGEVGRYHEAIFYGVDPDVYIKRERTAATGALENITA